MSFSNPYNHEHQHPRDASFPTASPSSRHHFGHLQNNNNMKNTIGHYTKLFFITQENTRAQTPLTFCVNSLRALVLRSGKVGERLPEPFRWKGDRRPECVHVCMCWWGGGGERRDARPTPDGVQMFSETLRGSLVAVRC